MADKRTTPEPELEEPTADVVWEAISEWRRLDAERKAAYEACDAARVRLVAVLRAAGVVGFTSL